MSKSEKTCFALFFVLIVVLVALACKAAPPAPQQQQQAGDTRPARYDIEKIGQNNYWDLYAIHDNDTGADVLFATCPESVALVQIRKDARQ